MCICPGCRSRSAPATAPPGSSTAQQQGLGGTPRATQPVPVNGTGQAGPMPAAAGAAAMQQPPMAHHPAPHALGRPGPGQATAAGAEQATAAAAGDFRVAAHAPMAPSTAAGAAAPGAGGAAAAAAALQPAPGGAEGQSAADAQPGPAAAPQNPVLSAARMVAARIAGQRAPQVLQGHRSYAGFGQVKLVFKSPPAHHFHHTCC